MTQAIIQCGDLIENHERVLPVCTYLKKLRITPRPLVYSNHGNFFAQHDIEVIKLKDYLEAVEKPFKVEDEVFADIVQIEREKSLNGKLPKMWTPYHVGRYYSACRKLLEVIAPEYLIVWNGYTGIVANVLRYLKDEQKLRGGYLERGIIKNSVFFDPRGVNGMSLLAKGSDTLINDSIFGGREVLQSINDEPVNLREEICESTLGFDLEAYTSTFEADRENVIFVPLQVQLDTNIIQHSHSVKTMRQLVIYAIQLAKSLGDDWRVVVREHPEEDPKSSILNLPKHALVTHRNDSELYDEIKSAKITLTINSTVGLEAAINGGFVIALGEGVYCRESFIARIEDEDLDFSNVAEKIQYHYENLDINFERLKKFLAILISGFHFPLIGNKTAQTQSRIDKLIQIDKSIQKELIQVPTIFQRASSIILDIIQNQKIVEIDSFLKITDTIDITYRTANVPVDLAYIEKALARYIGAEEEYDIVIHKDIGEQKSRFAIVSGDSYNEEELCSYDVVFDERMNIHPIMYAALQKPLGE